MSSTTETSAASLERMPADSLPLAENSPETPKLTITDATDCIETPEITVVDESRTPEPKPEHCGGQLGPVKEPDIALTNDASNSGSDANAVERDVHESIDDIKVDSADVIAVVKGDCANDRVIVAADKSVATNPAPSADSTDCASDVGAAGEEKAKDMSEKSEITDKSDKVKESASVGNEHEAKVPDSPSKAFFTDDIRGRLLDTIHENGSVTLKFSEYADLFVDVTGPNGRVYVFEVQSDVLAAASTVFHKMVYDTLKRGTKAEWKSKWVWNLSDSVIGLKVLFCMLHHKYVAALFSQAPQPQQIYEVLRTLSKYAIYDEAFYPMVKSWIHGFRKGIEDTTLTNLERLYVSYKLGDFKSLKICLRQVAHEVQIGEGGVLIFEGKSIQDVVPVNDELVANIRAVRIVDLKSLTVPLQTAYDSLMGDTDDAMDYCKSTDGHEECNAKILGSLLGCLRRQGLRPIPTPEEYTGTVLTLANKIANMEIRGLYVPSLTPHLQRHSLCKLSSDKVAKELLAGKAYLPIYDDLVEHMVMSAKRAGIAKDDKHEFADYKSVFNAASTKFNDEHLQKFWGWDEVAESVVSLFPVDDGSGIGEGVRKVWYETVPFQ